MNLLPDSMKNSLIAKQICCFLACLMLMLVVPIWRDHKIIGFDLPVDEKDRKIETITPTDNGFVINTTDIGKDLIGYGGPTPVEIFVTDGVISSIQPLPNQETPEFFGAVRNSDILEQFEGKTLEQASVARVDAVSGATYTSKAVIGNIRAGINHALDKQVMAETKQPHELGVKFWVTIAVILAAGIIPLFVKSKKYRIIQLMVNVGVLGFWGGTFISYSQMTSWLSNGVSQLVMLPVALMLVAAFIYPFFGKRDHYCLWMCPYGSLQELLGKCVKFKFKLSPGLVKALNKVREALWFVLMWLLWTGLCFDWMGYEPFAAFFFNDASLAVLIIAGVFLLLSVFIQRPYCRFVCPTGSLFKFSEASF